MEVSQSHAVHGQGHSWGKSVTLGRTGMETGDPTGIMQKHELLRSLSWALLPERPGRSRVFLEIHQNHIHCIHTSSWTGMASPVFLVQVSSNPTVPACLSLLPQDKLLPTHAHILSFCPGDQTHVLSPPPLSCSVQYSG